MKLARPSQLSGPSVLLEPLGLQHREPLRAAAAEDLRVWTYFPINFNGAGDDFDPWFDYTLERSAKDEHYPFAVRRIADDRVLGTTRYYDLSADHRRLAIGSTWYRPEARGTMINAEVRLLQLVYAFDRLGVHRVELITDPENLASRAAMKLLGAVEEGRIRNHLIYKDGRVRDSILFSIIGAEWPVVEARLSGQLGFGKAALRIDA